MKIGKRRRNLFWITLFVLITITGCNFTTPDITQTSTILDTQELTRREELAILKAKPSNTVDVDMLQNMANGILQAKNEARSIQDGSLTVITDVIKLPSLTDKRFTSANRNGRTINTIEEEPVELYYFTTENLQEDDSGFILMSNDNRIGYILAIVDNGNMADTENPFNEIFTTSLTEYIEHTITEYADITEAEILAAIEKWHEIDPQTRTLTSFWHGDEWVATGNVDSDFEPLVKKLLKTNWGQKEPYNAYVDYYQDRNNKLGHQDYRAGCVPVAMGQIIAYYGYITNHNKPGNFTVPARPTVSSSSAVASWNGTYNFTSLTAQSEISATASGKTNEELRGQVAALMHQIGISVKATYIDGSTSATNSNASSTFLNTFGYKSEKPGFINASTFSQNATSWTVTIHNNSRSWVINQLNAKPKARPVLIRGDRIDGTEKKGHMWIIDGYGTMTYYTEYLKKQGSSESFYSTLTLKNNTVLVHCNLGWSGDGNGWYIYGLFDTGNMAKLDGYSGENNSKRFYSHNIMVFSPYR